MARMLWLVWIALAVGVLATVGGATRAGLRGWAGWKTLSSVMSSITGALEDVATKAAATAEHATVTLERGSEIAAANERLQRSLAELHVLRNAANGAQEPLGWLSALRPRK
jgi:hypothetical protein